jgi:hypothetical protein
MTIARVNNMQGLDVRRMREAADARTARRAINLDLTLGGEYEARDGLRPVMPLDPRSKGLYSLGGTLRAIAPAGQGVPLNGVGPVRVRYDHIGFGDGYYASVMVAMTNSNEAQLVGGVWPEDVQGKTILIGGTEVFTVLSRVSDQFVLLNTTFAPPPGQYPFVVSTTPVFQSRTVSMQGSSDLVTLSNGTWPENVDGRNLSIVRTGYTSKVVARISPTVLRLQTAWEGTAVVAADFQLDGISTPYPLETLIRVTGVEAYGANASFGIYPYLVIERWIDAAHPEYGKVYEHHWVTREATDPNTSLTTQIRLPFSPGASILKAAGKIYAPDDVNGVVRFCSTVNGPSDWVSPQDAGYIPVLTHASGDRRIQGLGTYDDKMAVIFSDAVQLWATDPQPSNITLVRVINGPGTDQPRSVVNVLGDLFYFTRGGFRSLHMATVTGQIQEQDDIGGPIDDLAKEEKGEVGVALWSQRRGQYLCAFGSRVYAYRYSPKSKRMGWTTWELGVSVDAVVEQAGQTYLRAGDMLYVLDPEYDDGSEFELVLNDLTGKDPATNKRLDFVEVSQVGTSELRCYLKPDTDDFYVQGPTIKGSSLNYNRVFLGALSRTFGFRLTGKRPWRFAALQVTYHELSW